MAANPIDLYDKTKYGDESYFNAWYTNNINWVSKNRNSEEYLQLLDNVFIATTSS